MMGVVADVPVIADFPVVQIDGEEMVVGNRMPVPYINLAEGFLIMVLFGVLRSFMDALL